jgi:hypothetical protein
MGKSKNKRNNDSRIPTGSYLDYIGPGNWNTLHMMAINCRSDREKDAVLYLIDLYANNFYCKKCERHFREYVHSHPPQKYKDKPLGLFTWTWKAHNYTNKITGKKQMSYDEALEEYSFARR